MSNMSYCRFQNTLSDLEDCYEALLNEEGELSSEEEQDAKECLIELCRSISDEFRDGE